MQQTKTSRQVKAIFPSQVMNDSFYDHYRQHDVRGQYLYLFILGLISFCFASLFFIKVPVSIQADGILITPDVIASENLGKRSSEQPLFARIYVSPTDINLIEAGMKVDMYMDIYDDKLWGTVPGHVSGISSEVNIDNGVPFFIVSCSLNSHSLQLPNGYAGTLKKGMTLHGRFRLTERTLFQLLYDKPGQIKM